jgi:hypothetical protein
MNAYLRNGIITLITNVIIFFIGWGCIVPDQMMDQTHLFGLIGSYEIVKGNTAVVFGMCALLSTLTLIVSLVEAIVEDYRSCRFNQFAKAERPRKAPKPQVSGMRINDPCPEKNIDEDPKIPTLD